MNVELERKHSPYKEQAIELLESYGNLVSSKDQKIQIHSERAWHQFEAYPPEIQKWLLERFSAQFSVITELNESKTDFRDPVQSVWRILKKFNWKPPHDLFEKITKGDVIEIYLPDQTQLYRNLGYFNYTSYTLSELLFYPWHELFEHKQGFQEKIAEIFHKAFVEQAPDEYHFSLTSYEGKEKFSKDLLTVQLNCKSLASLKCRETNMNSALLVVWNIEILSKQETAPSREFTLESLNEKENTL